ncbi:uncharacterized protein K444DRAFT_221814 [Hyaloscypha bicolor E]|uniref:Uncharacterized protein n=1 Tax=Hyaloscypha bicolor E TaxID=1095630 RepID=A0A2J6SJJ5_9HELO|nr:uncharacterized protein K444DRAFT_221814 [Hyaloscypha bicolor E]PMD50941.1 hypothetical protein K444DRAFT_221814 [Hyaloscypha bicolor E]
MPVSCSRPFVSLRKASSVLLAVTAQIQVSFSEEAASIAAPSIAAEHPSLPTTYSTRPRVQILLSLSPKALKTLCVPISAIPPSSTNL